MNPRSLFQKLPTALRKWLTLLLPIAATIAAYPLHTLLLPYRPPIHTGDIFRFELRWFGIPSASGPLTPNQWLALHTTPVLDLLCGFAYVGYLLPILFLFIYLGRRDPSRALRLSWALLAMHLLAFTTYILFPAAPPWYVALHGLGPAKLDAPPSPAGVARLDSIIGVPLGHMFYANNKNVFGAIPSMHVGIQTIGVLAASTRHPRWLGTMIVMTVWIFFSAIYLNHHYIVDLLLGIAAATIAWYVVKPFFPASSTDASARPG